jgi:DNA repair exonuclease SbcCD nuclease subunit
VCRQPENRDISIFVIPGNHDPAIDSSKIVAENLTIIDTPTFHELDGRPFLFLPYRAGKTMGEEIAKYDRRLQANEWVLVGHGDWAGELRRPNPAEPGVYMPLTRSDIDTYKPARVFLGHIHSPTDEAPVHYPGSPCGLDITETGRRRCLFYDAHTDQVESHDIDPPVLYFSESFVIVPVEDEAAYLRRQIAFRQMDWGLTPAEKAKTQVRVKVAGYSADKAALQSVLGEAFAEFSFFKGQEPDIDDVNSSDDQDRQYIAEQVRTRIEGLSWPSGIDEPSADEILLAALHIIYKR